MVKQNLLVMIEGVEKINGCYYVDIVMPSLSIRSIIRYILKGEICYDTWITKQFNKEDLDFTFNKK